MTYFYSSKTIIMRNYLLSLFVALLATMGSLPAVAQEAYAVLTNNQTLTFYYDNQRTIHRDYGLVFDMPEHGNHPAWTGDYNTQNIKHVVFDTSFSGYRPTSTHSWFAYCVNLQDIEGIRNLNTEKVTHMNYMFNDCQSLTSLDLSNFNTQNVTDMRNMFFGCYALTSLDVSNFNTQNVKDMYGMFYNCSALTSLDVSNFNTQNVTYMDYMFYNCSALTSLDVSNFNTQNVTDMSEMFRYCSALTSLDVSKFNTQNITNMSYMFDGCEALTSLDVSKFNTQNVTYMQSMFQDCKALTSLDVSKFNTQNVTHMGGMFSDCKSLTTIYCNSNWKVRYKINDSSMFYNCTKLKGTNTAYNWKKTGIEMANPTTGYFTSKTTGIDHVKTADQAGDGKAYDLSGRRVNESYKGIVIKNGKKYIQK
ncbi:BspA family leucine-rich repeat surface protein [Hoylesella buccalis]|uniref:BspA family leucine-rich repeat surface protein n=1 Tax=Hoylesella buccalis TaxID=28127 RepID=UPI0026EB742B|nr:BspA family leucine-rich repeat surface protein [Hoylesella buccalis]